LPDGSARSVVPMKEPLAPVSAGGGGGLLTRSRKLESMLPCGDVIAS